MNEVTKKKVPVERYVEQVTDGRRYKGHLIIAGTQLDYELVFGVSIPKLIDIEPAKNEDEIRQVLQITVKRNGANIELTSEEYRFFLAMIPAFAIDFHDSPQTRDSNKGMMGAMLEGGGPLADIGGSASIGMKKSGTCVFPPKVCEMLSAPKFGCALAA